jgi:hypothetical protein
MSDSFQDVYAKHLQHAVYGYPLRMPEPMSTLPQNYQDGGLEIGDVGVVDNNGQFDVLFNICKHSDNPLHDLRGVPENFQPVQQGKVKFSGNARTAGPIHSHGIKQILQPNKPRYSSVRPSIYCFITDNIASAWGQPIMNSRRPPGLALFLYCRKALRLSNSYQQNSFAKWRRRVHLTGMSLPRSAMASGILIAPFTSSLDFTKLPPGLSVHSTTL